MGISSYTPARRFLDASCVWPGYVWSSTFAFPAFFLTEAIPRLIEDEVAYISDLPIGSLLAAKSTK
ncbi:MAG: hypothetical protein AMS18_09080 [Gemmatimonas sp. SG8_17]|nr:MAG: hypothetical protein AMS18_09080 [Gemmatimonas sp. SG8_17]